MNPNTGIPDLKFITKLAEEQQRGKVWLEFATALASNNKMLREAEDINFIAALADDFVFKYDERFKSNG